MLKTFLLTILLLGICILLIAIGSLCGRGSFRIMHACRMRNIGKHRQLKGQISKNQQKS